MERLTKLMLAGTIIATGCVEQAGVEVGPSGGIVESEDGRFMMEIPKGALEYAVEITVEEVECEQAESVGPCYEVDPLGLPLLRPSIVTYALDPGMLDGVDIEELTMLTERGEDWRPLADREIDMQSEVVVGSAIYLGAYAVVTVE